MPNPFQPTQPPNSKKIKPVQRFALLVPTVLILATFPAKALEREPSERALSPRAEHEKASASGAAQSSPDLTPEKPSSSGLWSFSFGVGFISDNAPVDYLFADFDRLEGPGEGVVYNFTIARQIKEFDWVIGDKHFRPQLEIPFRFTLVDEKAEGLIPDFNLGLVARWQDFPWNRYIYTTASIGFGLSYSSPVWTADQQRHSGENRSELKFWLPIELTFALPRYPN